MTTISVELPQGSAEFSYSWEDPPGDSLGVVAIAHGAGSTKDHPFLTGFAAALRAAGYSTIRFNFPYSEAGRRMPGPAAHAIATWQALVAHIRELSPQTKLWACGKSYGGRMASMAVAEGMSVDGLIYLGYPLHPPGRPEKPRVEHLPQVAPPQLFVEGTNDPFVQPISQLEEAVAACQDARIVWCEGGGHSFEVKGVKRTPEDTGASVVPPVLDFLRST